MPNLWRLHIRPYGGNGNVAASFALCLRRNVIGMGWAIPEDRPSRPLTFQEYLNRAVESYSESDLHSVRQFANGMATGDLVWFRSLEGRYFLAEIVGPWQYAYGDLDAIAADVVNFRKARIIDVGLADAVPGKIISCFRPSRTLQKIQSDNMLVFSEMVAGLPITGKIKFQLFEFLSDGDLEDLISMYLQFKGWYILPRTRTSTTAHYEFVLVAREGGERAVVQVKSGNTHIDASRYAGAEKAFLFAASEHYGADIPTNVEIIKRDDLERFMDDNPQLLPRAVNTWRSIATALLTPNDARAS